MKKKKLKKIFLSTFKIIISLLFIILVVRHIDFSEIVKLFKNSNVFFLITAFLLFIFSQVMSSQRLTGIFHTYGFKISQLSNLKLYFIGMFYNYFIPGGIGGDAYKVYALNKKFSWKLKTLFQTVFLDRLIGLYAILFLILMFAFHLFNIYLIIIILAAGIIFLFLSRHFTIKLFQKFSGVYSKSLWLSFGIQLLQGAAFLCLVLSLTDEVEYLSYLVVFFISSILSLISFSGVGAREYVFFQSSYYLILDPQIGVAAALAFNVLTALVSFIGVFYIVKSPEYTLSE